MAHAYTLAGTSTVNGVNTYRFASGKAGVRIANLKRCGHTDIVLHELPRTMNKKEAVEWLNAQGIHATLPRTGRGAKVQQDPAAQVAAAAAASAAATAAVVAAAAVAAADEQYMDNLGEPAADQVPAAVASDSMDELLDIVDVDQTAPVATTE